MRKKQLSGTDKRLETLAVDTEKQKKALVIQLRKTPIVQVACDRTDVGRSTYYKWRSDDLIFARAADSALEAGRFLINDVAESQLLRLIQDSNLTAIIFWLKHNHPQFSPRIIHEYDLTCPKISTEEQHAGFRMLADAMSRKMTRPSAEEIRSDKEMENLVEESDAEMDRKLKKYDDPDTN